MKKRIIPCFLAGSIVVMIGLLLLPELWWVSILPGFAIGYLAYEFGEVLEAIKKTFGELYADLIEVCKKIPEYWTNLRKWVNKLSVLGQHSLIGAFVFLIYAETVAWSWSTKVLGREEYFPSTVLGRLSILFLVMVWIFFYLVLCLIDNYSSKKQSPLTHWDAVKMYFEVLKKVICLPIIALGLLARVIIRLPKLVRTVIIRIHCQQRLACAIDGTIGGSLILFVSNGNHLLAYQYIILSLFGGISGIAVGYLGHTLAQRHKEMIN